MLVEAMMPFQCSRAFDTDELPSIRPSRVNAYDTKDLTERSFEAVESRQQDLQQDMTVADRFDSHDSTSTSPSSVDAMEASTAVVGVDHTTDLANHGSPSVVKLDANEPRRAHFAGPVEPALLEETIGARFASVVERYPHHIAVKTDTEQMTYHQLDVASDAFAIGLRTKLGISVGDRVAVSMGTVIPHFVTIYACIKLGAILVPLNPAYSPEQAVAAVKHITASCYITSSYISLPYKEPKSTRAVLDHIVEGDAFSSGRLVVFNNIPNKMPFHTPYGVVDYDWLVSSYKDHKLPQQIDLSPQDTINLQFTSGTTSSPKAVALSHWSILNNAYINNRLCGTTEADVIPSTMPLYHCGGLVLCVLNEMLSGSCITIPSESFNALRTMRILVKDRCTILQGVPTMLQALVRLFQDPEFASHDFSHIRAGWVGGSSIPPTLRQDLKNWLPSCDFRNIFGMTEMSPILTMSIPSEDQLDPRQIYTVGRAIAHTEVRIVARDDPTHTLAVGEKGEIIGTGMAMKGYWEDPIRTAAAFVTITGSDGCDRVWMRTGDEGVLDADGFLSVTGRIKDIIIRGGENIYPIEIEDVLLSHAGVKDVAIAGIPDANYGEVVAAFVVPQDAAFASAHGGGDFDLRPASTGKAVLERLDSGYESAHDGDAKGKVELTGEDLRSEVRARLSRHLVPKFVFWLDRLPLTPSGKVEKFKLEAMGSAAIASAAD